MPDLPACRAALSQAATTLRACVDALDMDHIHRNWSKHIPLTPNELRADIQAARTQLDRAEAALTGEVK